MIHIAIYYFNHFRFHRINYKIDSFYFIGVNFLLASTLIINHIFKKLL